MLKRPDQRVAVLIDTQNMYHSAKNLFNAKVNFGALVDAAVGPRQMVRTIAYVAKSKGGEETGFFEALQNVGIELKIKDVQEFSGGAKKADWDVGMAIDAVALAPRVDAIVLVTGDGDFVPLVEYLQTHGVACECVAFAESTNATLKERVNQFTNLSDDPASVLIGYRGKQKQEQTPVNAPVIIPAPTQPHSIQNPVHTAKPSAQKQETHAAPESLIPTKSKDIKRSNSILSAFAPVSQSPHFVQKTPVTPPQQQQKPHSKPQQPNTQQKQRPPKQKQKPKQQKPKVG